MKLTELNTLSHDELRRHLTACCGSSKWTSLMLLEAPFLSEKVLFDAADRSWSACGEEDWLEAFRHHPKIGDMESLRHKFASTRHLAGSEQSAVSGASEDILRALQSGNEEYEQKFGFIFIVFATGKSAEEMLRLLQQRLPNNRIAELNTAAAEQYKITLLRLKKLVE